MLTATNGFLCVLCACRSCDCARSYAIGGAVVWALVVQRMLRPSESVPAPKGDPPRVPADVTEATITNSGPAAKAA